MTEVSIGEWMAVITLGGTLIVGVAKFYAMFTKLDHTLGKLENTIVRVEKSQIEYGNRLSIIEEQIKSIFKQIGKEVK
ncbi:MULTISPECIES: hypothetical protein [Enterococcus]|uniref:Uncharacterized protein n=1 Tax=Enterococcus mundtii TaxID=53346 RepID=A0A1V2UKN9_ENTMU|nr:MULTISPECIES: hypothetical protein [Enterococcus]AZP92878.1 hypothetical protein CYK55_07080 [Enterococcus mundtii]EYT95745.1 hypothetical protein AK89_06220 [Enterococcus mundtii CRL35]MBE9911868.1 hypothetical protein [Enterococcus mundtii]MCA6774232.1 hypothetical protein [Enterococcus mundtii]MDA9428891.1 hypothetical protein [Enterococcus mundtii 1A]